MIKLAAVVILYYPPKGFLRNILSYYSYVEKLFVYDNTEVTQYQEYFRELDRVVYVHSGKNEGVAKRLNQACALAQKEGYDWALTMDQDSCFSEAAIQNYLHNVKAHSDKEKIAVFGVTTSDDLNYPLDRNNDEEDTLLIDTSGSILNLLAAKEIGGFDENLFIDGLDHEFCLRAKLKGYRTIRLKNIRLLHPVGEQVYRASFKTLFIVKKKKWIHNPLRCYYILRNMLYVEEKYSRVFPDFIRDQTAWVNRHLHNSLWYGYQFLRTWWYIQMAKKDFKRGIMGKIKER